MWVEPGILRKLLFQNVQCGVVMLWWHKLGQCWRVEVKWRILRKLGADFLLLEGSVDRITQHEHENTQREQLSGYKYMRIIHA